MLEKYIPRLTQELELKEGSLYNGKGAYILPLGEGFKIVMTNLQNGFMLKSSVVLFPKDEEFTTEVMYGNLFGQGTDGATLGLSEDETALTLTQIVDYPIDYKEFKSILEKFISVHEFWREEAFNIKKVS